MTSYLVSFFDEENGDLVSSFGIEASSTLDMLYNILSQEWEQGGILMIHEDDMDDIFENFLIQILILRAIIQSWVTPGIGPHKMDGCLKFL
jgi:hypothetical protein